MKWIAGIDGGGSKTAVFLRSVSGDDKLECQVESISPKDHGIEGYAERITGAFIKLGVNMEDVVSACVGVPCFGEYPDLDEEVVACTRRLFPSGLIRCENDCFVGFAGAFGLKSGINVVAGTGAIVYGEDDYGHCARSNGWHHAFSDEGSGVWLGREAFALFGRQMDGRVERSSLYDVFMQGLGLKRDIDVITYYSAHCENDRAGLAKTQELLLQAARLGDKNAIALYEGAAGHLCESVAAVYKKLRFKDEVRVSYSGGVFKADNFLLGPFFRFVQQEIPNSIVSAPLYSPEQGAALAAERLFREGKERGL